MRLPIFLLALLLGGSARQAPEVAIAQGRLAGASDGGVLVFKGIPYAAPPVGPLRWRAPRPGPH